jgi:intraflagellar transport protein 122
MHTRASVPFRFVLDGSFLVVSAGPRLVIFNAVDGSVRTHKVCHQRDIFCLSVSRDGAYIASGGGDKAISVWNWDLNQKYTFTHADVLQAVAFNPVATNVLATVSAIDFAIWTMPSTSVKKIKLPARACCTAWTSDGQMLTIGLHSGIISVRDLSGAEKFSLRRSAPIWDVHWALAKGVVVDGAASAHPVDLLTVACWDGTISFYTTDGTQVGRDVQSPNGGLPCSISSFSGGEYIVVAGSDKKATLMTRDGVKLNTVAESKDWIWNAVTRPRSSSIAVVSNNGTISLHSITFSTVHGLYGDRYALRESCTDVVVSHLTSDTRVRIKCRDYVKKVAVYKDRLAVQLPDRIIIYETVPVDESLSSSKAGGAAISSPTTSHSSTVMYRVRDKIIASLECNLLVVTSSHVVLCLDKKLALYSFKGVRKRPRFRCGYCALYN